MMAATVALLALAIGQVAADDVPEKARAPVSRAQTPSAAPS